jgi:hypothetical protein
METITGRDASAFVACAGSDLDRWRMLIGQKATHPLYGAGIIVDVEQKGEYRFHVRFGDTQEADLTFTEFVLAEQFESSLPDAVYAAFKTERARVLAEEERREEEPTEAKAQLQREAEARNDFAGLKKKYQVAWDDSSPVSRLYQILRRLDESSRMAKSDIEWLETWGLSDLLGRLYEGRFLKYGDPWDLVKASSHWRT